MVARNTFRQKETRSATSTNEACHTIEGDNTRQSQYVKDAAMTLIQTFHGNATNGTELTAVYAEQPAANCAVAVMVQGFVWLAVFVNARPCLPYGSRTLADLIQPAGGVLTPESIGSV